LTKKTFPPLAAAEAAWTEREKAKPKAQRRPIPKYSYDSKKESATDIIAILNEIVFPELNRIGLYEKPSPEQVRKIYEWYLTYKGVVPYPYVRNLLQADQAKFELIAAYAENATAIPGITIQERPKRRYPLRALGGHFVGYLRETRTEKPPESEGSWDFFESDDVGQAGIEKTENDVLRGKPGERVWLKNEHGRLTEEIESLRRDPLPGGDVYLTIDARAQIIAENTMREAKVGRGAAVGLWHGQRFCVGVGQPQRLRVADTHRGAVGAARVGVGRRVHLNNKVAVGHGL
jgi:cell division protein FtsI/penicillin-binding protein 2